MIFSIQWQLVGTNSICARSFITPGHFSKRPDLPVGIMPSFCKGMQLQVLMVSQFRWVKHNSVSLHQWNKIIILIAQPSYLLRLFHTVSLLPFLLELSHETSFCQSSNSQFYTTMLKVSQFSCRVLNSVSLLAREWRVISQLLVLVSFFICRCCLFCSAATLLNSIIVRVSRDLWKTPIIRY